MPEKDIYRLDLPWLKRMQKTSKYYWWFQIGGWLSLALIMILISILFGQGVDQQFFVALGHYKYW